MKKCKIWWCDKPYYANGYCKAHDTANKRFGSPFGKHKTQMDRINREIALARWVSVAVTEFVKRPNLSGFCGEELDAEWVHDETYHDASVCPFCHSKDGEHDILCAVRLSNFILADTK